MAAAAGISRGQSYPVPEIGPGQPVAVYVNFTGRYLPRNPGVGHS